MASSQKATLGQNVSALAFFLLVVSFAVSYVWLLPLREKSLTAYAHAKAKETGFAQDLANIRSAQTQLQSAEDGLTARGVSLDKVARVMPANEDVPDLYVEMEALVGAGTAQHLSGVKYSIGTPTQSASSKMSQVPVTVTATGGYADIKAYIITLEHSLRPISLDRVSLAPMTADASASAPQSVTPGHYSLTLSGSVWGASLSPAYSSSSK